jgi:hypothetical protein
MTSLVPVEVITSKIYLIRGMKVMLDRDLTEPYSVEKTLKGTLKDFRKISCLSLKKRIINL